jgi:hypothetical protein
MNYLMNEVLKPGSDDYYNAAQSDVQALVRGELNVLKASLFAAKSRAIDTETRYHYIDCVKRIDLILDPK